MKNHKLCKHATLFNDGRHKYLLCNEINSVCCFFRWCNNEMCFKMLDKYMQKCKLAKQGG